MQDIGGSLRSHRKGKLVARALLAARLRHGRIKLAWDPSRTAAERKTKAERKAIVAESTEHYKPEEPPDFAKLTKNEDATEYVLPPDTDNTQRFFDAPETSDTPENVELCEHVHFAQRTKVPKYVLLASNVIYRRHIVNTGRMKYNFKRLIWWLMMVAATAEPATCSTSSAPEEQESWWFWILVLASLHIMLFWACSFWAGVPRVNFDPNVGRLHPER